MFLKEIVSGKHGNETCHLARMYLPMYLWFEGRYIEKSKGTGTLPGNLSHPVFHCTFQEKFFFMESFLQSPHFR